MVIGGGGGGGDDDDDDDDDDDLRGGRAGAGQAGACGRRSAAGARGYGPPSRRDSTEKG